MEVTRSSKKARTFCFRCRFRGFLSDRLALEIPKDDAAPLELALDPTVPEYFDRVGLLDHPDEGDLEYAGTDANLDPRHRREGKQVFPNPVLLVRLFGF